MAVAAGLSELDGIFTFFLKKEEELVPTAFPGGRHVFNFTSNWLWQNFN